MSKKLSKLGLATALSFGVATAASAFAPASAENFMLRIGSGHNEKTVGYVKMMTEFFVPEVTRRVAEETDDTIEFVEGYSGSIVGVFDTLEGVQDGVIDIGGICACFEADKMAALNINYFLPFSSPDGETSVKVFEQLLAEFPQITEDLEGMFNQVMIGDGVTGFSNYGIGTAFPWEDKSELVGHKILAAGPNLPWLPEGAVGVNTTLPTAFEQLDTGVGEGIIIFPGTYFGFRFFEPAPNFKVTNFGNTVQTLMTMNLDTRAALPAEIVAIINEVASDWKFKTAEYEKANEEKGLVELAKIIPVTEISAEAQADWANDLIDFPAERASFLNDKVPGETDYAQVMCRAIELFREAGHEFPANYGGPLNCS